MHTMRNVLVPTDFSAASLELVEKTAQALAGESLHIVLFHAFDIPFFVSDIVRSPTLPYQDLLTEPFRQACCTVKHLFPKTIRSIAVRHLHGNSNAVFRNFADANDIDLIVYPEYYVFQPVHTGSVNPHGMFMKAGIPLLRTFLPRKRVEAGETMIHTDNLKAELYAVKEEHTLQVHFREN